MKTLHKHLLLLFWIITCILISQPTQAQSERASDELVYKVVTNKEAQYVIWLNNERAPKGWRDTQITGSLEKCHNYIKGVWTDMRPLLIQKEFSRDVKYGVVFEAEFLGAYQIWPISLSPPEGYEVTRMKGSFCSLPPFVALPLL
jgi:MbtH protein